MMDWLKKKFIFGWVKSLLEKLPFDGWKTIVGILLVVLGEIMRSMPQHAPYVQLVIDLLNHVGSDPVTDIGIVALITGAVHKLIKFFDHSK